MCNLRQCPECGGPIAHRNHRGMHESTSELGQYVHDQLPSDFGWADIDGAVRKAEHRLLRIVEGKRTDEDISHKRNQIAVLRLLAHAVDLLVRENVLHPQSGVFLVRGDPPFDAGARVERFHRGPSRHPREHYDHATLDAFLSGQVLP